jgi:ubiquinone/menaquinone biosynthesis C-methylase UbiE
VYKSEQVANLGVGYEAEYFRFNRAKYLERWEHRVRKCQRQLLACLEFVDHPTPAVLDIGCSAGYVLEAARRLHMPAVGADLSRFAVELCRARGYEAQEGSAESLPFEKQQFDIVTIKHTLEHVQQPLAALREIHRVLKPGGVLFVIVPDVAYYKLTLMPRRGRSYRPDRRGWQHHVYFGEKNLALAAQQAAFTPLHAGKAIFRRKQKPQWWEILRFAALAAWVWGCRVTRLRREIQLIAQAGSA